MLPQDYLTPRHKDTKDYTTIFVSLCLGVRNNNSHPHLHRLVPDGAWDRSGTLYRISKVDSSRGPLCRWSHQMA